MKQKLLHLAVAVVVIAAGFSQFTAQADYYYGGALSLSQTSLSLNVDQSANIQIYGGSQPYTIYPSSANIAQTIISGSTLQVIGLNYGSSTLNVCSSGGGNSGGCAILYVTVGYNYPYPTYTPTPYPAPYPTPYPTPYYYPTPYPTPYPPVPYLSPVTFSQSNPSLAVGQNITVSVSGGNSSSYYIAHNSNTGSLQATLNGNSLSLYGLNTANVVVVVCSSSANCGALTVMVNALAVYSTNPSSYSYCATEGGYCYFSGTRTVQYGANGVYTYRTFTNNVLCSNAVFGDPIFGVVKNCRVSN